VGPLASLGGKLIAVDTAPFIYFIERHPGYIDRVRPFFQAVDRGEITVITSSITLTEVLVVPLRLGDRQLVDKYTRILLHADHIATVEVSNEIAAEAAQIRSTYRFKTPDAIHLATAIVEGADGFLTNDATLAKVAALNIILVDQLS
jgi:predicted nucleic acid-binding protein